MASRIIFQVDQTTSENKIILWHIRERGEDTNLDGTFYYLIVAIIRKRLKIEASLYTILQILSVSLFEKTYILQALSDIPPNFEEYRSPNQLNLFNL